eukprot:gene4126-4525_t
MNTSSPEFHALAAETYRKVLPCLTSAWMISQDQSKQKIRFQFPYDAEFHYEELKNKTACYRNQPIHEYAGYSGPWIENLFIQHYLHRPLASFHGFIPLFIQWIDNQILRGRYFDYIYAELGVLLRPNVLYLAISQGDVGLGKIGIRYPNILVLSAGGFGHIPIPLVKGLLSPSPPPPPPATTTTYPTTIGFYGNIRQSIRSAMFDIIKQEANKFNLTYRDGQGSTWIEDMKNTKFNLAPRGYGRSSFRFAESIQLGRIPVFLYNDIPWIPYQGTKFSVEYYGYVAGLTSKENTLISLVKNISELSEEDYQVKLSHLHHVRQAFTYPGIFHEFDLFLRDPFGSHGGHLRCVKHPRTERY